MAVLLLYYSPVAYSQFDSNRGIWFSDLQLAFENPDRVYNLDLSGHGLDSIPEYLPVFRNLESLKLSDNNLRTLSPYLNQLPKLKYLELSGNRIRQPDFSQLDRLKYSLEALWMRDNQITRIDASINVLQSLTLLDMGNNKISSLDSSIQLKYLEVLRLDHNYLAAAPALLYQSPKLQELNLYGNLLDSFQLDERHVYLRKLNLGSNPITALRIVPASYRLHTLLLDWVEIDLSAFPPLPRSIETLSLEHCQLTSIPAFILELPRLQELSLMHNNLSTLPEAVCHLPRLKKLWMGGNPIDWQKNLCGQVSLEIIK